MSAPLEKVALVAGGVRGLGLACARSLAERGDRVHITYRGSHAAARELEAVFPGRVHRSDALVSADWAQLVATLRARDDRLDHFVHAVGEYVHGPLEHASAAELRRMLASNVESAYAGFEAVRPLLRASRGSAVFFGCSGIDGVRARRDAALYAASKTALAVLVKSWAVEEAPHGVRVNMVTPGHVPHAHASDDTKDPALWSRIPMQRPGAPEEVAGAVRWLCSSEASYTTGALLDVGGGFML
ncbi:MAG: SDR family oxidoreductase [Planctomycetes bacterium]|nr:SDR family oxidoreductase [Planctomycetota bacterium]